MRPEHHILATELEDVFRKSLQECLSSAESTDLWKKSDANGKAKRFLELNSQASAALLNGHSQIAVINAPSFVHMFWLLDVDDTSVRQYVDLLLDIKIGQSFPLTKFWTAYSQALAKFSGMSVSAAPKHKLVGYEKFWEPYLDFLTGNISEKDFETQAASSFATRNRQSRSIDWRSLDGDAKNPVKWDFRYASIRQKSESLIKQS